MKKVFLFALLLFLGRCGFAQKYATTSLNNIETEILNLVNDHRVANGLSELQISQALCFVADEHAKDLYYNKTYEETGSLNSWSRKSGTKPINYNRNKNAVKKMKKKPSELTNYSGESIEIVYYNNGVVNVGDVLNLWKLHHQSNSVMLNRQPYAYPKWEVMGIAEFNGFVCLWFGPTVENAELIKIDRNSYPSKQQIAVVPKGKDGAPEKKHEEVIQPKIYDFDNVDGRPTRFYVIVFSSTDESNCRDFFKGMLNRGYQDAEILKTNGKIRVAIDRFDTHEEADKFKNKIIQTTEFKDAWILKR